MSKAKKHGPVRSQIEAFAVAIVMALVIKTFAFEAYQVPTESMEPTIIGRNPGGDRIIVNRYGVMFSDPERNSVLVFRYPLSRALNYVKRLVGMPGERLEIHHGDIYAAPTHDGEAVVTRKPHGVQQAIFDANDVIPEDRCENFERFQFERLWELPREGVEAKFEAQGGPLALTATSAEARIELKRAISPVRHDAYAARRKGVQDSNLADLPMSDVRFSTRMEVSKGAVATLEIVDATFQPLRVIRLEVEPGASDKSNRARLFFGERGKEELIPVRLHGDWAGKELAVVLENVDDSIRVRFDGEQVLEHDYVQAPPPFDTELRKKSVVAFRVRGGKVTFHRLAVHRDLYYSRFDDADPVYKIPQEHYMFMGDNSANSLDARGWRAVAIRMRDSGKILVGDREAVSDDFAWPRRDSNPYFPSERMAGGRVQISTRLEHHFLDMQGNTHVLAPGSYDLLNLGALVQSGTTEVLGLHGTTLSNPAPEAIAQAAVDSEFLTSLGTPLGFKSDSLFAHTVLMHFVHRHDLAGEAVTSFWPWDRIGIIR